MGPPVNDLYHKTQEKSWLSCAIKSPEIPDHHKYEKREEEDRLATDLVKNFGFPFVVVMLVNARPHCGLVLVARQESSPEGKASHPPMQAPIGESDDDAERDVPPDRKKTGSRSTLCYTLFQLVILGNSFS